MKAVRKPRLTTARNSRKVVFKYYPIKGNKTHKVSFLAGRCVSCNKITDAYCDSCHAWVCENHLIKGLEDGECFCQNCRKS